MRGRLGRTVPPFHKRRVRPTLSAEIDITDNLHQIKVPTLLFGGWQDLFTEGPVQDFTGRWDRTWLVMNTGQHIPAWFDPNIPVPIGAVLAWWDHWLLQSPDAPLPSARVTRFEGPWPEDMAGASSEPGHPQTSIPRHVPERGPEPHRGIRPPRQRRRPGRSLRRAGSELDLNYGAYPEDPAQDQAPADQRRLTFTTGALSEDTVIAGSPRAHLRAALSAADRYFVVKVEDVAPDGKVITVTDGYLKASRRDGQDHDVALTPGQFYYYTIAISPTH